MDTLCQIPDANIQQLDRCQVAVTNTSVATSLLTFIGILTFHIVQSVWKWRVPCFPCFKNSPVPSTVQLQVGQDTDRVRPYPQYCAPTFTVIELSQLRESLLMHALEVTSHVCIFFACCI